MRLVVAREGDSFFVQGEWVDQMGTHTRAMKEDFTPEIEAAIAAVMGWAETCEGSYREAVGDYENRRNLEREKALIEDRLKALDKARRR